MKKKGMTRREFVKTAGIVVGASALCGPSLARATKTGSLVQPCKIMTATANFDPVRPEGARLISMALREHLGWEGAQHYPCDYKENVQKVIMEHDFDAWLVRFTGSANCIDPNVFTYKVHHSSQYKPGGYNCMGYSNPEVDRLCEAQQVETDINKRRGIIFKVQEIIHQDQPENIFVYCKMTNAHRSDRISGLVPMMGEGIGSFWSDINMKVLKGDEYIKTGQTIPIKNLNPIDAKDMAEFRALRMIYDRLFRIGPDGRPQPWAASSLDMPDPRTINVSIREGMAFHDGKSVTSEDVKFTYDYLKKWKSPYFLESLTRIESVEITGKYSVRFKLTAAYVPIVSNLLAMAFILPKHIWAEIPEKVDVEDPMHYANEHPIGSGPFRFEYWDQGRELKLSTFVEHFNAPKYAGNIIIQYGSQDAMAAAIEKGECDMTRYIIKPSLMKDLDKVEGIVGKAYPSHGFYDLAYNTRRAPFDDPIFRRAIAHVLPREIFRDVCLEGYAEIGGSIISPVNKFWHNPEVKAFPNDVSKARRMLAEAGYSWDSKGRLHYPTNKK